MLAQAAFVPVGEITGPTADARQATAYLETLHRGAQGIASFVLLRPPRQERHSFIPAPSLVRVSGQAADYSRDYLADVVGERWNLYTGCSTLRAVPDKGRGRREHIESVPGVWADLDVKPGVEGYFQTEAELEDYVRRLHPPTMQVASGSGGRHLYWLTHTRMDQETGSKLLANWLDLLRDIADGYVIENVQDTPRILRIAGTVRWPKFDDMQATEPMPVQLIDCDGPRYPIDELLLAAQAAAGKAETDRHQHRVERQEIEDQRIRALAANGVQGSGSLMREFNRYADWEQLLIPAGWSLFSDQRDGAARCRYWVRPGKNTRDGKSASTDFVNDDGATSESMTIYSQDPSLLVLWENAGSSDAHGICSKWHFAHTMLCPDDATMVEFAGKLVHTVKVHLESVR